MISILIACYKSAKTIEPVICEIEKIFKNQTKYTYEIILVNDGSPDNTFEIIEKIAEEHQNIIGVNLSKNYGQLSAKMAGLQYVNGEYLVYMDDDGQCPTDRIFDLISCLEAGYDIAYAAYTEKQTTLFKKITSDIHGKLTEVTLGKPKGIKISNFYAINRLVIDSLRKYKSPFPSPLGYMLQITKKIANVPMVEKKRLAGKSNYNLKRLFSQWMTVFTNFSIVPLRIISSIGFSTTLISFLMMIYLIIRKLIVGSLSGYTSIACLILFLGGLNLISLGLIGEYIGRIYITISGKPVYTIKNVVGLSEEKHNG